ncbi:MAG: hypothetical protein ABJK37_11450 [Paraglaciecola sp.]|uniref:hypothetical protein n=1 Tax=Paraglaciecola sp. TaxID=1920173 RepID=UPI003297F6E7
MATDIAPVAEIVGSFIYGGALGVGYAVVNLAVENYTGKSIYGNILDGLAERLNSTSMHTCL